VFAALQDGGSLFGQYVAPPELEQNEQPRGATHSEEPQHLLAVRIGDHPAAGAFHARCCAPAVAPWTAILPSVIEDDRRTPCAAAGSALDLAGGVTGQTANLGSEAYVAPRTRPAAQVLS